MKARKWTKETALNHWRTLPDNANPLRVMIPVPYKREGSKYGECGIRIDGTPEFIDAVLGRLKAIIDGENCITRLELARRPVDGRLEIGGKSKEFAAGYGGNAEVCYVRLCERGGEAVALNGIAATSGEREATSRYASLFGEEF